MICRSCRDKEHELCRGGTWCDCQHRAFYEEDQPVEDVIAAFEAGEKGLTAPPRRGVTKYFVPVLQEPRLGPK